MVEDVEPYELMKLRLLTCSHQSLAYFGLLLGHTYADEAAVDEHLAPFTRTLYMDREGTPTVPEVPGMDLTAYNDGGRDRKSTRLNSSHVAISYAVFCLKKKTQA